MQALPTDMKPSDLVHSHQVEVREIRNRQMEAMVRGHLLRIDSPKEWGGDDTAPNPGETFVFALGGCVINTARLIAQEEELDLERISVSIETSVDLSKVLGLDTTSRAGFREFVIRVRLEGKLSTEEKSKLLDELRRRCPLCDTVGNSTPFTIGLCDEPLNAG